MAFSKANLYAQPLHLQANYARALGHPERLSTIHFLNQNGARNVNEIAKQSPLHANTVGQHLAILRASHLVSCNEVFPYTVYSLNRQELDTLQKIFNEFFDGLKNQALVE
jgi:DNA-binding transcriptional ArsR family regulator